MKSHDVKIIEVANQMPLLKEAIDANICGGGGFHNSGTGKISAITGDIVWKLRCNSFHAYKCPASLRIVFRKAMGTLHVEVAKGWEHKHTGTLLTTVGLPPSVKHIIDGIVQTNPGIKLRAVKHLLWENHNVSKEDFDSKIASYFYRGCGARRQNTDVTTGVSSYGTVQTFVDSNQLFDLIPKHTVSLNHGYLDVPGVIGSMIKPAEGRCAVIISTAKLLLDTHVQTGQGYSRGQLHGDFTHKMLQELIPFFVASVPDIQQHVHLTAMGPCTHQDKEMLLVVWMAIKEAITKLVRMIIFEEWPDNYGQATRAALCVYKSVLIECEQNRAAGEALSRDRVVYMPGRGMYDAADAFGNAAMPVFDDVDFVVLMCWVHVWRAVKGKHYLLRTNNEATQKELYQDLLFIHNITVEELVPICIEKFKVKWVQVKKEPAMVAYLTAEWFKRKWSRAYGQPGEPSDNNTIEVLNRVLKQNPAFAKTTSMGMCLPACLTVAYRTSRDMTPLFSRIAPVVKKDQWVKAQKLVEKSLFKLSYKMNDDLIVPSEALLSKLPGTTVKERRKNISDWVVEYVALMKNPSGYYKAVGPRSWDFDTIMDYLHSFYVVKRITSAHPRSLDLAKVGIINTCNCPQFMHYHVCKHALGAAISANMVTVPNAFSAQIVGKRSASPGRKSSKRSKCLELDY